MKKVKIVLVVLAAVVLLGGGIFLGAKIMGSGSFSLFGLFGEPAEPVITETNALTPQEILENFEISALEYRYRDILNIEISEVKKIAKIKLPIGWGSSIKQCTVQFDGRAKMGINGKDILIEEVVPAPEPETGTETQAVPETTANADGKKILRITIPKAYIISHEAPYGGEVNVILDVSQGTKEKISIKEQNAALAKKIKEIKKEIEKSEMILQAQESAATQIKAFLNSIPDIRDNYTLDLVLA